MLNINLNGIDFVQKDSLFIKPKVPSAHLVTIVEGKSKERIDKNTNLVKGYNLELTMQILNSSYGAEDVGSNISCIATYKGNQDAVNIGLHRLSVIANILQVPLQLNTGNEFNGREFIVLIDKQKGAEFIDFKRFLTRDGLELAPSGTFKECSSTSALLQGELQILLERLQGKEPSQPSNAKPFELSGGNLSSATVGGNPFAGTGAGSTPTTNFNAFANGQAPVQAQATAQVQAPVEQPVQQTQPVQQPSFAPTNFGGGQPVVNNAQVGQPQVVTQQPQTVQFGGQPQAGNWANSVLNANGGQTPTFGNQ